MRVIMTGGGTGGHVNPAIAIANTIKRNDPDAEILFVGTARGIENKLCTSEGYPIKHVEIMGFRRSLSLKNFKAAYLAFTSPIKAKKLVREFAPDIVIGTGGYVCWPVLVAASKLGIPTAVHESNAFPGVAVRRLQPYVDRIWLNFEESAKYLTESDKIRHVGNPLRSSFGAISREKARKELGIDGKYDSYILSFGGSMGAEKVNDACLELMRDFVSKNPRVLHQHATGSIEWEAANEKFKNFGLLSHENAVLSEYIYDMPLRMAAADIVISRAGAMTVSELAMMKKTSIMIPSPNVTNNHQYKNAKVISDNGGAVLLEEKELQGGRLQKEVERLISDSEFRTKMGEAISHFADLDANKLIYDDIIKLVRGRKK
ncbi:MAG: undecaprenyldiphospho-muramoylpentapeptide beta-N-acetylglucosaminyltransferase [Clostridia bacterium]|nr:undecaprenyldiphospho-muramoylpentapeptide beta-N-acetylglucosaminyltransferase [Clostridia bacterium]